MPAEIQTIAKPQQAGRFGLDIDVADRLRLRIPQLDRFKDRQRAKGNDERRQAHFGDQKPVDQPHQRTKENPDQNCKPSGQSGDHGKVAHDQRRQHQDRTNRQINASGQNDQRLGKGNKAGDSDLFQDNRQRTKAHEAWRDNAEPDDRNHQHQGRDRGRIGTQEIADARHKAFVVTLETGDRGI
jgi:hypothetical protein